MTLFGSIKELYHSITTPDHYASYSGDRPSGHDAVPLAPPSQGSSTDLYAHGNRSQQLNTPRSNSTDIPMAPLGPSVKVAWDRIIEWMEENYPELHDQILDGVTRRDIKEFENDIDVVLPQDVKDSIALHDGQERGGRPTGLFFGIELLDMESIVEEWSIWRNAAIRVNEARHSGRLQIGVQRCVPADAVQCVYAHPAWIPLAKDGGGNNIAVDLSPGPKGRVGQIILFGRDFDTKYVVAPSWSHFLDMFANDLQHGRPYVDDDIEQPIFAMREGQRMVSYFDVLRRRTLKNAQPAAKNPNLSTPKLVLEDTSIKLEPKGGTPTASKGEQRGLGIGSSEPLASPPSEVVLPHTASASESALEASDPTSETEATNIFPESGKEPADAKHKAVDASNSSKKNKNKNKKKAHNLNDLQEEAL